MDKVIAKARMIIRKTPAAVFDAFVSAETMSKFWFTRRDEGLVEGQTIAWYIGDDDDAPTIDVRVKQLKKPEAIEIEWGQGGTFTQVAWRIEAHGDGCARLTIEESGFAGSDEKVIERALDSTAGFNQVIVALKALLEHDTQINVVADHA